MKKVLVALDTSPVAPHVLAQGALFARALGGEVVLLRAVGIPTELPPEALTMAPDGVTRLLLENAGKDLDRLAAALPEGVAVRREVRVGVPWQVVCDVAEEHDVDLIVMGAHGHQFLDKVLGTTTSRVVAHTDRSTLVVRVPRASDS